MGAEAGGQVERGRGGVEGTVRGTPRVAFSLCHTDDRETGLGTGVLRLGPTSAPMWAVAPQASELSCLNLCSCVQERH